MQYINNIDWCNLSSVVETTAKKIWSNDLPEDLNISFNELRNECYIKCGRLVGSYKPGERSLKSYVFEYLRGNVLNSIYADYRKHHSAVLSYIDEGTYNDDGEYIEKHEYGEYDVAKFIDDTKRLEDIDSIKTVYEKANKIDKLIIDLILDGKNITDVANDIGMSRMQIYRRLQKYQKYIEL